MGRLTDMEQWARERDRVFTDFVLTDDLTGVMTFCRENGVQMPDETNTLKAGVYKAVQECRKIPESVKALARQKCVALGFRPTMRP